MSETVILSGLVSRQSVSATIIRACRHCGAPGVVDGQPTGEICHNCGEDRPPDENKGEIWFREFRTQGVSKWKLLSEYIAAALFRIVQRWK